MTFENISHDIKISVRTKFEKIVSLKTVEQYIFSYKVHLLNLGQADVKLMSRKWHIHNARGDEKIVEGEGVIGQQPVISSGSTFEYESWCPLNTEMGKMFGYYKMVELKNNTEIKVTIPEFQFNTHFMLN